MAGIARGESEPAMLARLLLSIAEVIRACGACAKAVVAAKNTVAAMVARRTAAVFWGAKKIVIENSMIGPRRVICRESG